MIRTVLAAAAAFALAAPAFAGQPVSEIRVSTAGKSPAEVHTAIVKAASQVCYQQTRGEALFAHVYPACIRESVDRAVAQLGDSRVLAFHQANPQLAGR